MQEEDKCPICGSDELMYDAFELVSSSYGYYPVDCQKCGAHFDQVYSLKFVEYNNIVTDDNEVI